MEVHIELQNCKNICKGDVSYSYSCAISVLYVRRFLLNESRDTHRVCEHIQFPYIHLKALNLRKVLNFDIVYNNGDHLVRDFTYIKPLQAYLIEN